MAVGVPVLAVENTDTVGTQTVINTASFTPVGGEYYVAFIAATRATAATAPSTVAHTSIPFASLGSRGYDTGAAPASFLSAWGGFASGSPVNAVVAMTWGTVMTSQTWAIYRLVTVDPTTPIPPSHVKTSFSDSTGISTALTLDALTAAGNGYLVATSLNGAPADVLPRTNWTQLSEVAGTGPTSKLHVQYRLGATDNASASWASGNLRYSMIGLEMADAAGVVEAPAPDGTIYRTRWRRR